MTVIVPSTEIAEAYAAELSVGVSPFVVKRIVAPDCGDDIVTVTPPTYVPVAGAMVGAASVPKFIAYVPLVSSDVDHCDLKAAARSVVVVLMGIGPLYSGDVPVGTEPSSVYRTMAPVVAVWSVTDVGDANVPPGGERDGGAALSSYATAATTLATK